MIEFKSVSKVYHMGEEIIKAIDEINFTIPDEKFTVILGPSGSGKSTTLNLLGGMDTATSGDIYLDKVADQVIRLKDGKIQSCVMNDHPAAIDEVEW